MRRAPGWLLVVCAGCAKAATGEADATVDALEIDAPPPIDAPRLITLNQTDSQVVTPQASVACTQQGPPQVSKENSYYRAFALEGWTGERPLTPVKVDFGVEQVASTVGSHAVEVRLHTLTGPLALASLTMVASEQVTLPTSGITAVSVPIDPAPVIAPRSTLVAEVLSPDGTMNGASFFIGANKEGESATGYLRAPDCGLLEPTPYADLGFPTVRLVLTVSGTY